MAGSELAQRDLTVRQDGERIDSFEGEYRFLSNFSDHALELGGRLFASAEHAYQACKTLDPDEQKEVQLARSPAAAKRAGRQVTLRPDWEGVKVEVMRQVLRAKFAEGRALADKLLATGDAELIEGNDWHDNFWGECVCLGCINETGRNFLGELLMERRYQLRAT
jgi:ribA/ribD-fused uncharacterized protein